VPDTATPAVGTDGAEDFVRAFYTAIDARRYEDAWAILPAGVRSQVGGFERWTATLDETRSNVPNDIVTSVRGDRVDVRLRLAVLEQGCPIARDYSVTWTLGHAAGEWTVAGLRMSADGRSSCG
jgi:hypothetical protein